MVGVGQAHQQLTCGHDGVVAVHITEAVVVGCCTARHQHAAVSGSIVHGAVAARNGGRGGEVAGRFTAHKARVADTEVASCIGQSIKLGIVVGRDGERFFGDEATQARGRSDAVVTLHTGVGGATHTEGAGGRDGNGIGAVVFAGKGAGLCEHQGVARHCAIQRATCERGHQGAVIGAAGHTGASHRQRFGGDGDRCIGRIQHRQAVVTGQACGGTAATVGQRNGADVFAQRAHVCIVGGCAAVAQHLRANAAVHRHVARQARGAIVSF